MSIALEIILVFSPLYSPNNKTAQRADRELRRDRRRVTQRAVISGLRSRRKKKRIFLSEGKCSILHQPGPSFPVIDED